MRGRLAVGIVLARLLAFLLLDGHFAAADEAVNAKLNQESRRSSQRTGEMTDVRHLHFGEPVPVNALADFSSEQARQEQAVFLVRMSRASRCWFRVIPGARPTFRSSACPGAARA
ncbi:hypothetical protein [Klebsiella pneumoniae]|uniref:hypothetical protein n=1 Tax=Klebsiella pneumoniae TaxID=573 RepID=UPI0021B0DB0B|nr:hypothetical protein [Klebsiella pneumoniae]